MPEACDRAGDPVWLLDLTFAVPPLCDLGLPYTPTSARACDSLQLSQAARLGRGAPGHDTRPGSPRPNPPRVGGTQLHAPRFGTTKRHSHPSDEYRGTAKAGPIGKRGGVPATRHEQGCGRGRSHAAATGTALGTAHELAAGRRRPLRRLRDRAQRTFLFHYYRKAGPASPLRQAGVTRSLSSAWPHSARWSSGRRSSVVTALAAIQARARGRDGSGVKRPLVDGFDDLTGG
jgi:hypothetical protein